MMILTLVLQLAAGGAAIARVATDDYRASRGWAIAAQSLIAGDYALKTLAAADAAYLVGLTTQCWLRYARPRPRPAPGSRSPIAVTCASLSGSPGV
jgi:hypothetical protein